MNWKIGQNIYDVAWRENNTQKNKINRLRNLKNRVRNSCILAIKIRIRGEETWGKAIFDETVSISELTKISTHILRNNTDQDETNT